MDTFLEILKWIGIVLVAGFIGYFGRYAATRLLRRWEKGKSEGEKAPPYPGEPEGPADYKIEKKIAKQAVKTAKKVSKD